MKVHATRPRVAAAGRPPPSHLPPPRKTPSRPLSRAPAPARGGRRAGRVAQAGGAELLQLREQADDLGLRREALHEERDGGPAERV